MSTVFDIWNALVSVGLVPVGFFFLMKTVKPSRSPRRLQAGLAVLALAELVFVLIVITSSHWWLIILHVLAAAVSWWLSRDRVTLHKEITKAFGDSNKPEMSDELGDLLVRIVQSYPKATVVAQVSGWQNGGIDLYIDDRWLGNVMVEDGYGVFGSIYYDFPNGLRRQEDYTCNRLTLTHDAVQGYVVLLWQHADR